MKNGFPESRDEFFECIVNSMACKYCVFTDVCNLPDDTGSGRRTSDDCKKLLMKAYNIAKQNEN